MGNFQNIAVGQYFYIDGEPFRKTGPLTFEDLGKIEHYINPMQDAKILAQAPAKPAAAAAGTELDEQAFIVDPQSRVMTKNPNFGKPKTGEATEAAKPPQPPTTPTAAKPKKGKKNADALFNKPSAKKLATTPVNNPTPTPKKK